MYTTEFLVGAKHICRPVNVMNCDDYMQLYIFVQMPTMYTMLTLSIVYVPICILAHFKLSLFLSVSLFLTVAVCPTTY